MPTQYTSYKVNTGEKLVTEEKYQVKAQKIPLLEIRRLLKHHEELGLIRNKPDEYYDKLTIDEQRLQLKALGENEEMSDEEAQQHFKNIGRQRFFKVWHDHSAIAGHGHILVAVACVYDPAFYYTQAEMGGIDVQCVVEKPQIHILGRSSSSLEDQALFNECRIDCIKEMSEILHTSSGIPIRDILRYFHGDGPAQQYEAGHSIGGHYPCVGCGVQTTSIAQIEVGFKSPTLTLQERRDFIVIGHVWKKGGINPFDKLKVHDLRC